MFFLREALFAVRYMGVEALQLYPVMPAAHLGRQDTAQGLALTDQMDGPVELLLHSTRRRRHHQFPLDVQGTPNGASRSKALRAARSEVWGSMREGAQRPIAHWMPFDIKASPCSSFHVAA